MITFSDDTRRRIVLATAKSAWDAERKLLAETHPEWQMPAWSRAQAWRRRPYILDALAERSL